LIPGVLRRESGRSPRPKSRFPPLVSVRTGPSRLPTGATSIPDPDGTTNSPPPLPAVRPYPPSLCVAPRSPGATFQYPSGIRIRHPSELSRDSGCAFDHPVAEGHGGSVHVIAVTSVLKDAHPKPIVVGRTATAPASLSLDSTPGSVLLIAVTDSDRIGDGTVEVVVGGGAGDGGFPSVEASLKSCRRSITSN